MKSKTKKIITIGGIIAILLVLVFVITKITFSGSTSNINSINLQVLSDIDNSLQQDENLIILVNSEIEKTSIAENGQESFGIPIGFEPNNPDAWNNDKRGCTYNVEPELNECISCCINQGWDNPKGDIISGYKEIPFGQIEDEKGYALIRINIPKDVEPCIQPFVVTVNCEGDSNETASNYFNIQIIKKKGLF